MPRQYWHPEPAIRGLERALDAVERAILGSLAAYLREDQQEALSDGLEKAYEAIHKVADRALRQARKAASKNRPLPGSNGTPLGLVMYEPAARRPRGDAR